MITITHHPKGFVLCHSDLASRDADWRDKHRYHVGFSKPNYPMPAIRYRTVSSLINLGYVSALNNFDVDTVFEYYVKD